MAVTKIRKISSWSLIGMILITLLVYPLFLFGGDNPPLAGKSWYPKNIDLFLYWLYISMGLTVGAALVFALMGFIRNLKQDVKKALFGVGVIVAFVALFVITYAIGNGEPMPELDTPSSRDYNIPMWLKTTDMVIYSIYIMFGVTLACVIWGELKGKFSK